MTLASPWIPESNVKPLIHRDVKLVVSSRVLDLVSSATGAVVEWKAALGSLERASALELDPGLESHLYHLLGWELGKLLNFLSLICLFGKQGNHT